MQLQFEAVKFGGLFILVENQAAVEIRSFIAYDLKACRNLNVGDFRRPLIYLKPCLILGIPGRIASENIAAGTGQICIVPLNLPLRLDFVNRTFIELLPSVVFVHVLAWLTEGVTEIEVLVIDIYHVVALVCHYKVARRVYVKQSQPYSCHVFRRRAHPAEIPLYGIVIGFELFYNPGILVISGCHCCPV